MDPEFPSAFKYKKSANATDPIVNFQLNNPIPPLKRILKRLFSNEEITIKIPILTAITLVAFGLGGASGFLTAIKIELANRIPVVATIFPTEPPLASPNPWVSDTLFGTLSKVNLDYFLISEKGEVTKLIAPQNVNLEKLTGKKILAVGIYNKSAKTMNVQEASDLLLFSSTAPVPTLSPTPQPTLEPTLTPLSPTNTPEVMY